MKSMLIPKKAGTFRTVFMPEPDEKRRLRALVPQLNLLAEELDVHKVQHGFTEGRSPVTNARCHIGFEFTLTMDLSEFFDTVSLEMVDNALLAHAGPWECPPITECFVHCRAVQGLPTSPALANIAFSPADKDIVALCPKGRFAEAAMKYTRYADDLTFSCRTMATVELLLREVPKICERHGFKVNASKTKVQCSAAGRRIITGIAVGEKDITIPRETRRRIRAGDHQAKGTLKKRNVRRLFANQKRWKRKLPLRFRFHCQLQGLKEWAKLRVPHADRLPKNKVIAAAARVVTAVVGQKISQKVFGSWARRFG